jgi:hypothetical protein
MKFLKCPNGLVWALDAEKLISGTVVVTGYEDAVLETRLDSIAAAATGSIVGLHDLTHTYLGEDRVRYHAWPAILFNEADGCKELDADADFDELKTALMAQYNLGDMEAEHILDNVDVEYSEECTLAIVGTGREIRCPAAPAPCEYVRVVVDGLEIAYWHEDEWARAPAEVMGAFIGAARSS